MKKMMWGWLLLVTTFVFVIAADKVVETGEGRGRTFTLTAGDIITHADSMTNWESINSVVIVETSGTNPVTVECWLRSMKGTFLVRPGRSMTLPVEFLNLDRVLADHGDSVITCISGACDVTVVGG